MPITPEQFKHVQSKYGSYASWAIWGDLAGSSPITGANLNFPADAPGLLDALHTDYIILGLNPGDAHTGGTWKNFHTGTKHNDDVLGEALRGTPAWGGYMRDLLPNRIQSKHNLVAVNQQAVFDLVDELRAIGGNPNPVLVTLGAKARDAVIKANKTLTPSYRHIALPHYSRQNGGYVKTEHAKLFGPSDMPSGEKYKQIVHHRFQQHAA